MSLLDEAAISGAETVEEGGQTKQIVQNGSAEQLLTGIFKELKMINLHLSLLTDTTIKNTEVE